MRDEPEFAPLNYLLVFFGGEGGDAGRRMVSTTAPCLSRCAWVTGMNCPVPASRPILVVTVFARVICVPHTVTVENPGDLHVALVGCRLRELTLPTEEMQAQALGVSRAAIPRRTLPGLSLSTTSSRSMYIRY